MDENTICLPLDVKLDIREKKSEFLHLKTWTKYLVKIETIKCVPCYIKISFLKNANDERTDLVVRINIPGLTVQMATSRTKPHSYGLFWKNNRKRCCAYFAFESQMLCDRHIQWMKKSIKNLELYRQEVLQNHRESQLTLEGYPFYENFSSTQSVKDIKDILGPLPKIPDNLNWSRRASGLSEIYEEIDDRYMNNRQRMSCVSIASGIYEEMRLPEIREISESPPPPLPPRSRTNTGEFELHRSFTNPECDYFQKRKKHWALFDTVFGRKRSDSCSSSSKSPKPARKPSKERILGFKLNLNRRNSFSSPDLCNPLLSNQNVEEDDEETGYESAEFLNNSMSSCVSNSIGDLFVEEVSKMNLLEEENMNITHQIKPNFNMSCNSSTVNLVGSNFNTTVKNSRELPLPIEDPLDGYCPMGAPGTGFDRSKLQNSPITFTREYKFEFNEEPIYENFKDNEKENFEEPHYLPMLGKEVKEEPRPESPKFHALIYNSPVKIPRAQIDLKLLKTPTNFISRSVDSSPMNCDRSEICKSLQMTPKLYQKYTSIARMTTNKYLEKSTAKKCELATKLSSFSHFKKIDLSPLKIKINSVLQRDPHQNHHRSNSESCHYT